MISWGSGDGDDDLTPYAFSVANPLAVVLPQSLLSRRPPAAAAVSRSRPATQTPPLGTGCGLVDSRRATLAHAEQRQRQRQRQVDLAVGLGRDGTTDMERCDYLEIAADPHGCRAVALPITV